MNIKGGMLFALVLSSVATVSADTVTMTYEGTTGNPAGPLCSAGEGGLYYWSDNLAPHDGADYVPNKQFRTPIGSEGTAWVFEGDSIDINVNLLLKTVWPSTLTFADEMRVSSSSGFYHNQDVPGAVDLTAKKFRFARVQFNPCPGNNEGGIRLHGPVVSDDTSVARGSQFLQIFGNENHPGTFVDFDGDCSGFGGRVELFANATLTGSSGFPSVNFVRIYSPSVIKVKSSGFTLKAPYTADAGTGERQIVFDSSTGSIGTLRLTGSLASMINPFVLRVSDMAALSAGGTYTLVTSDTPFDPALLRIDPVMTNTVPRASVEVSSDNKSIILTVCPTVKAVKTGTMTGEGADYIWSDNGNLPGPGKDYLIPSAAAEFIVRTPESSTDSPYPKFLGDMLCLGGVNAVLYLRELSFDVPMLCALPGSTIRFYEQKANTLTGKVILPGEDLADPVIGQAYYARTWTFGAELTGSGAFAFSGYHTSSSAPGTIVNLTSQNTNFTGRLAVKMSMAGEFDGEAYGKIYSGAVIPNLNYCGYETLRISDPRSLGGDRPSFARDALKLTHMSLLDVQSSMTLEAENRGLLVHEYGRVSVADGKTLSVKWPVTYNGIFRKEGAGTLALGAWSRFGLNDDSADATPPTAGANQFRVMAGYVQALTATAYNGLSLQFADGAGIAIDPVAADADAKRLGISVGATGSVTAEGATIPVRVVGTAETLPLDASFGVLTMLDNPESRAVGAKLAAVRVPGRRIDIAPVANVENGTVTYVAHVYKSGLMLNFR